MTVVNFTFLLLSVLNEKRENKTKVYEEVGLKMNLLKKWHGFLNLWDIADEVSSISDHPGRNSELCCWRRGSILAPVLRPRISATQKVGIRRILHLIDKWVHKADSLRAKVRCFSGHNNHCLPRLSQHRPVFTRPTGTARDPAVACCLPNEAVFIWPPVKAPSRPL